MDRREAMLRELNLYPSWVRREQPVPEITQQAMPIVGAGEHVEHAQVASDEIADVTHSTGLPEQGNQAAGGSFPPEDLLMEPLAIRPGDQTTLAESQVLAGQPENGNQTAGSKLPAEHLLMEPLAIRLGDQTTLAESLVMALQPEEGIQTVGDRSHADDLLTLDLKDDVQVTGSLSQGVDTLREFQLKNAEGALGQLTWPELKQKVRDCELCNLRAGCTQTVCGVGREQADWMFIGEAPGAEEDALGEPFVGPAGQLLDNMLMAIKLKRLDVYIANVIKCRPVDDRHPHVGEIAACLPYLKRQISLVQPKLIVALGKTAASALLGTDATIGSLRGALHDYKGIPLIVTYHPAYLLRSPMEKAKAWQDLCLAVDTMKGLPV